MSAATETPSIQSLLAQEQEEQKQRIASLAQFQATVVREETLQNAAIAKAKSFQLEMRVSASKHRVNYLKQLEQLSLHSKESAENLFNTYTTQLTPATLSKCEYLWQLVGCVERISFSNLSFIIDHHVFLEGKLVYRLLSDALIAFDPSIKLVNMTPEQVQNTSSNGGTKSQPMDERGLEELWNSLVKESEEEPVNQRILFFLDLEKITPIKILLLAKLQKFFESIKNDRDSKRMQLVVYTDDVLSQQLKTPSFTPEFEFVFAEHRMPCRMNFTNGTGTSLLVNQQTRSKEIKQIVEDSIRKYKKSFKKFDILIFLKNASEAQYVDDHVLKLIKENINVINLTEIPIESDSKTTNEDPKKEDVKESIPLVEEKSNVEIKDKPEDAPPVEAEKVLVPDIEVEVSVAAPVVVVAVPAVPAAEVEVEVSVAVAVDDVPEVAVVAAAPAEIKIEKPIENERKETFEKIKNLREANPYKKGEFNVFIAKSHKQLRNQPLENVLISIDSGEGEKVYYLDTAFKNIPTVSSKITREEAVKRERLLGSSTAFESFRLYSRKDFLRLQKRDFLNTLNLERFRTFAEILAESCKETQALRILLYVSMNLAESWFSCLTETGAHVSLLWSRHGDVFSLANCIQSISKESSQRLSCINYNLKELLEKNQIDSYQFDRILCELNSIASALNLTGDVIGVIQKMDASKLQETLQRIIVEKYYQNLCVYSGHRRHGFKHFHSGQHVHYADNSSMNLIQERPFLIIPLQLSINSKNQFEIKHCIAVEHMLFLESAPASFIDQHRLRLLKRQSLNLHEIEYFGIATAMVQHFNTNAQLIRDFENEFDCYYEPNRHLDTITIHCDASKKEKIEKRFGELMEIAKKTIDEELLEFAHGKNSIVKIEKGGIVKEVVILENEHEFFVDNLPLTVKEQDLIDLFSEYGEILKVRLFEPAISVNPAEEQSQDFEKTLSAEVLVADTEDSAFFVEVFDEVLFQGRTIALRNKSHSYKLHDVDDPKQTFSIIRWQTWKSKGTATIQFKDAENVVALLAENPTINVDGSSITLEQDKSFPLIVNLKNLNPVTDETSIIEVLGNYGKNIASIHVDRVADNDRGTSKMNLNFLLKKIYGHSNGVEWVQRREHGFVEAKIKFPANRAYQINELNNINKQPGKLGLQKIYIETTYMQDFHYDMKMQKILEMILSSNEELLKMEKSNQITISSKIVRPVPSKEEVLVQLKSNNDTHFDSAKTIMGLLLSPKILDLRNIKLDLASLFDEEDQVDYTQIFTQIGLNKLNELEQQYPVVFKVNLKKEEVRVYCSDSIYNLVNKDVEYFLRQSIRVKIPVSGKNIRNVLGIDGKGLEELQKRYQLVKIQLDYISKDVYMQGESKHVEKATNALMALLEEKNAQSFSYEECQVCSDTIQSGYRLQGCGHKFCVNCIMFVIDNSLGDINSFPLKCPCCSVPMVLKDILAMMSEEQIEKLQRMSLNKHVHTNFTTLTYCVNENCRSVHSSSLTKYTCYECKKTYCSKCSVEYHFGYTCTQYQETEAKNIEYLLKEGARKCPKCGVYIIRIDGCYRVECQRCNSHICWKDNCMIFFDNASDCYSHLDQKHGGYW